MGEPNSVTARVQPFEGETMTELSRFDYELPDELITATPAERREEARLLLLGRDDGAGRMLRL